MSTFRAASAVARRLLCLSALIVFGAGDLALAQTPTFNIEGTVSDAQQAVLPGATVTVRNVSTGLTRVATTDAAGRYVFTSLPPAGTYTIQTELSGFATESRESLQFRAGQRAVLNITLKLSTVQETITVAGAAPIIETSSAEVSKTIDSVALETLPVKERNYFRLITLDSNVVARAPGTNAVNVGGGEVWNFGTYVDGTNNHSKWLTLQRAPQRGSGGFALETVREVQIISNQFSAEFGGHSAGVMSMVTKSGANGVFGSTFVSIRPGEWDAKPPLSPVKAPYNQQQFGGTVGGPFVKDRAFYFGSYEGRRERSQVVVTSPEASGLVVPTPANEHQGHFRGDIRFSSSQSLAVRYNMVRWNQDTEAGGLSLPGTGFLWDNNVDTVHGTFQSLVSDKFLNEVRGQFSRYTDQRNAKCNCVQFNRAGYSISGGVADGSWGVIPEDTWDISDTVSLWRGAHTMKMGASLTYDVTTQLYQPNQNGIYRFRGSPTVAPTPFQFDQSFALDPSARLMYPKSYVFGSFFQDDWRVKNNLTLNLGVRYDVEMIHDIPYWPVPTDANNVDPRVGFAWDPKGDQKWSVRGGFGGFTQQFAIFTIAKGAVGGRNGIVQLSLVPSDPAFPVYPNNLPAFPPGAVLPPRNIQEISPDLKNEHAWTSNIGFQRQLGPRASLSVDANINRGTKQGFLDINAPTTIPKAVINAGNGAVVRTQAQADATRPITPVPNGFRRIEILGNEGRSWYQGVRVAFQHRTKPLSVQVSYTRSKAEDQLNHWFAPENSTNPELDRAPTGADTPNNFVAGVTWNLPGTNAMLKDWRLSGVFHGQSGSPYTVRYGADLTGTGMTQCSSRGCQITQPGDRNTERGDFINYMDVSLARTLDVAKDRLELRIDAFNVGNAQNFVSDGYIGIVGNVNYGKATSSPFPGRQFQVAATYRF